MGPPDPLRSGAGEVKFCVPRCLRQGSTASHVYLVCLHAPDGCHLPLAEGHTGCRHLVSREVVCRYRKRPRDITDLWQLTVIPGIADPGSVELSGDEVINLVEHYGFKVEKKEDGLKAGYIQDAEAMLQNTYQATHWLARKL